MIFLCSVNQWESRGAAIKCIVGILWSTSHTKVQLTRGGFLNPAANNMKADSRKTLSVEAFKNLLGVEYPQVFFREGQGSSSELHAYSLMAAVVSSQEVPLFRRGLRSQHGSRAASTRSVNCAAAPCEAPRLRAGPAAAPEEQFLPHADSVLASLTLWHCDGVTEPPGLFIWKCVIFPAPQD